ncbi:MAG: glycosyltransferase family 61 protein [Sphingobium sp.]
MHARPDPHPATDAPPSRWTGEAGRAMRGMPHLSIRPGLHLLCRLFGHTPADIAVKAADQWEVAPPGVVRVRPARMLPGQIDRIRGSEFAPLAEVLRDFAGGFDSLQPSTTAFRLRDVLLIDGMLYAGNAARHLRARTSRMPIGIAPREIVRASFYESWVGNRWFGNWLSDDCLTYRLAEAAGGPVTTNPPSGHMGAYERGLGMAPSRMSAALFEELILFDDRSHNDGKRARAGDMRRRLVGPEPKHHPGTFLLRGGTGARRVLRNERAIAEHLAARRGFRVLDPSSASLEEIVRDCAGARVIAGVEGSHLVHGLMLMPPGATALVIQPPTRAVSALKLLTDRQGQDYSLVVGVGSDESFDAGIGEIERTLDLG